jgi:hypothetical protein
MVGGEVSGTKSTTKSRENLRRGPLNVVYTGHGALLGRYVYSVVAHIL